jgi:hypothetical protein
MGTFHGIDAWADMFPKSTYVFGAPQAGWFFPNVATFQNWYIYYYHHHYHY